MLQLGSPTTAPDIHTHGCSQVWRFAQPEIFRDSVEHDAAFVPLCKQAVTKAEEIFSGESEG
jgi:hypothetical protein